jgi:hypothetical protein
MSTLVKITYYSVDPRGALVPDPAGLQFRGALPAEAGAGSAAIKQAFVRWRAHWGTARFRIVAWSATAPAGEVDTTQTDWWELPAAVRSFTVEGTREHSAVEVAASLIEVPH